MPLPSAPCCLRCAWRRLLPLLQQLNSAVGGIHSPEHLSPRCLEHRSGTLPGCRLQKGNGDGTRPNSQPGGDRGLRVQNSRRRSCRRGGLAPRGRWRPEGEEGRLKLTRCLLIFRAQGASCVFLPVNASLCFWENTSLSLVKGRRCTKSLRTPGRA